MLTLFLLVLGSILLFYDFFLGSYVLVVLGGILIIASVVVFATSIQSALLTALFIIGVVVALIYLCKFALWKVKSTKDQESLYSESNQEGYIASTFDATAIGKIGVVLADLKPGGYISVEGHKHAAISLTGYISKGNEVIVVGGEGESLTVQSFQKDETI